MTAGFPSLRLKVMFSERDWTEDVPGALFAPRSTSKPYLRIQVTRTQCVAAHERTLREAGVDREAILEALKAAAIVAGVAQAIATAKALATAG